MRNCTVTLICCLFFCVQVQAQVQEDPAYSGQKFINLMQDDLSMITGSLNAKSLTLIGSAGIIATSLMVFDQSTSYHIRSRYKDSGYLNAINELGNKNLVVPLAAGIFGGSLLTKNTKFQEAAFTSLEALLLTNITVNAAKFAFGRSRPLEESGSADFNYFMPGKTSFPSGHTANAFALLTPWILYYPNPFTYSLFVLPVSTGIARISRNKHWLSDVAVGAAVGLSYAVALTKNHRKDETLNIDVFPIVDAETVAIGLTYKF